MKPKGFHLIFESLASACVTCGAPRQVGSALTYREVQAFDERRVDRCGVLGFQKRLFESPVSANDAATLSTNHAVVPSRLQHLRVDAADAKEASNDLLVVLESIGHDERKADLPHPCSGVFEERARVSIATPTDDGRRPKARGDVERREDPHDVILPSGERSNLVRLDFRDIELLDVCVIELPTVQSGSLEPSVHGVPAESFDPGDRELADAFDAERGDVRTVYL